ncbi:MAG TPA: metallophosphoesterase [Polyangia bacterium]|nr:metallophosphoesterase [Polyangia bacterium]
MRSKPSWMMVTVAAALAWGAGCDSNQSGNISAKEVGDLSHALSQRGWGTLDLVGCDLSVPVAAIPEALRRRPFLQKMTDRSVEVVWTTDGKTGDGAVVVTSPDGTPVTSAAAARDSSAHPLAGAIQWSAAIAGLASDTRYCYELRADGVAVRRGGFRTAPAGGGQPVRFVAFGDSGGGGPDQRAVLAQLRTVPFDFMIHLGDIAYESGTRAQLDGAFFQMYADLLEDFPMFPASGNHEYETDDALPFREAFVLPENGGPGGVERWYSYDWGDVHFAVLDSERMGAPQAAWLDTDLTANRRPWTIVYFHRPPFSSGDHGGDGNVQKYFVPILVNHHVPLVLSGHDHDYERTKPIDGVTYVVSGGGGRGTRPVGQSAFTAFSEAVIHFVYVTVEGRQLTLHAIDGAGLEFDSLLLTLSTK